MRRSRNINGWRVMAHKCATCPFGPKGDPEVMAGVIGRVAGLQASQICHHPILYGKQETHLCRGARDIQLRIMCSMGILNEATDKAFNNKWKELQRIK